MQIMETILLDAGSLGIAVGVCMWVIARQAKRITTLENNLDAEIEKRQKQYTELSNKIVQLQTEIQQKLAS